MECGHEIEMDSHKCDKDEGGVQTKLEGSDSMVYEESDTNVGNDNYLCDNGEPKVCDDDRDILSTTEDLEMYVSDGEGVNVSHNECLDTSSEVEGLDMYVSDGEDTRELSLPEVQSSNMSSDSDVHKNTRSSHKGCRIVTKTEQKQYPLEKYKIDRGVEQNSAIQENEVSLNKPEYLRTVRILDIKNHGGRRYKCSECDQTAFTTGTLYKHMRSVHKGFKIVMKTGQKQNQLEKFKDGQGVDQTMDLPGVVSINSVEATSSSSVEIEPNFCESDEIEPVRTIQEQKGSWHKPECRGTVRILDIIKPGRHRYKCSECNQTACTTGNLYRHMKTHHKGFKIVMKTEQKQDQLEKSKGDQGVDQTVDLSGVVSMNSMEATSSVEIEPNFFETIETTVHEKKGSWHKPEYLGTVGVVVIKNHGRRRYKCSECDQTSSITGNLYRHMKTHHRGFRIAMRTEQKQIEFDKSKGRQGVDQTMDLPGVVSMNAMEATSSSSVEIEPNFCESVETEPVRTIQEQKGSWHKPEYRGTVRILDIKKPGRHRYKCSECNQTACTTGNLYRHMKTHHKGFKIVMKTEQKQDQLEKSKGDHGVGKSVKIPWCALKTSMENASSVRIEPNYCETIEKTGLVGTEQENEESWCKPEFRGTVRVVDIKKPWGHRYKCSECDKSALTTGHLYRHMRYHHKGFRIVRKTEQKQNQLEKSKGAQGVDQTMNIPDIVSVNGTVKFYQCCECDEISLSSSDLYNHVQKSQHERFKIVKKSAHRKSRSFMGKKDGADVKLDNENVVSTHLNTEMDQPCHGSFGDTDLVCSNTGNDGKPYSIKPQKIVQIMDIPTVQRHKYKCSECDMTSNDTNNLYRHMKNRHKLFKIVKGVGLKKAESGEDVKRSRGVVHIVDNPKIAVKTHRYKCSKCDRTSFSSTVLYTHMKNVHKGFRILKKTDFKGKQPFMGKKNENGPKVLHARFIPTNSIQSRSSGDPYPQSCKTLKSGKFVRILNIQTYGRSRYKCSECEVTSYSTSILYRHMQLSHKDFKILKKMKYVNSRSIMDIKKREIQVDVGKNGDAVANCKPKSSSIEINPKCYETSQNTVSISLNQGNGETYRCEDNPGVVKIVTIPKVGGHHYKCSECDRTSYSMNVLYKHMKYRHKGFRIIRKIDYKKCLLLIEKSSKVDNDGEDQNIHAVAPMNDMPKNPGQGIDSKFSETNSTILDQQNANNSNGIIKSDSFKKNKIVRIVNVAAKGHQYKCSKCNRTSHSTSILFKHMEAMHKGLEIIKKTDHRKGNIIVDEKKEIDAKGKNIPNQRSDSKEYTQETLGVVQTIDIPSPNVEGYRYECRLCDKTTRGRRGMYFHMIHCHKGFKMDYKDYKRFIEYTCNYDGDDCDPMNTNESSIGRILSPDNGNPQEKEKGLETLGVAQIVDIPNSKIGGHRYKCSLCKRTSIETGNLYRHMRLCHKGFKIMRKKDFEKIRRDNKKRESFKEYSRVVGDHYKFPHSKRTSDLKSNINRHMRLCHKGFKITRKMDSEEIREDSEKSESFEEYSGIVYIEDIPNPKVGGHLYKCSLCDKTNSYAYKMYRHMKICHKGFKLIRKFDYRKFVVYECKRNNDSTDLDLPYTIRRLTMDDFGILQVKEKQSLGVLLILDIPNPKVKGHRYKCSACDKTTISTFDMYKHMRRNHKGCQIIRQMDDKDLEPVCNSDDDDYDNSCRNVNESCFGGMSRSEYRDLQEKETRLCSGVKLGIVEIEDIPNPKVGGHRYKCSLCKMTSITTGNLYRHMRYCHRGFKIMRKKDYKKIEMNARKDKIYQSHAVTLLRKDHGKTKKVRILDNPYNKDDPYKCSECERIGCSSQTLYKHMQLCHKGLEIVYDYEQINTNSAIKDGIRSFECSLCMTTFSSSSDLDSHVKIHEEDTMYNSTYDSSSSDQSYDEGHVSDNVSVSVLAPSIWDFAV